MPISLRSSSTVSSECPAANASFARPLSFRNASRRLYVLSAGEGGSAIRLSSSKRAASIIADNGWSIDRAHQALAEMVQRQGWEQETNAVYQAGKTRKPTNVAVAVLHTKARDFENATGAKSAERVAMDEIPKLLHAAQSWSDVHSALTPRGFRYEQKGSGALVWVGETAVKASAIGREFSRKRMEERFGPLEPTAEKMAVAPTAQVLKPLRVEEGNRWQEYRTFLETHRMEKDQAQSALRTSQRGARRADRKLSG